MGYDVASELLAEIKKASSLIEAGDAPIDAVERAINEVMKAHGRPGLASDGFDGSERADAIGLCVTKHMLDRPKDDGNAPDYTPSSGEIDEAIRCKKAITKLFRTGELNHLDGAERKSLTSFSLGGSNFIFPRK
jgi:hypothetical protein